MKSPALLRVFWLCVTAVAFASDADAQGDLDAGKTGAQLFASHCNACHRSPQGLAKQTIGLTSFLRQHYTTNSTHAAALAEYVSAAGPDPRAGRATAAGQGGPKERASGRQAARPNVDPRLPDDPNAPVAPSAPSAGAAEPPKPPPARRDPRLPVSVSTDPDPFVISREPMTVPPDLTPRRVLSAVRPTPPAQNETTAAGAIPASAPSVTGGTAALPAGHGASPGASGGLAAAIDQPGFSAPLP